VKDVEPMRRRGATSSAHGTGHRRKLTRVNRAIGQLEGVRRMIEERRYCIDILNQTKAAASALRALEGETLRDHLRQCLQRAFHAGTAREIEAKITELVQLVATQPR
jgi:DNA-binding FrmR family transcriptional regulator